MFFCRVLILNSATVGHNSRQLHMSSNIRIESIYNPHKSHNKSLVFFACGPLLKNTIRHPPGGESQRPRRPPRTTTAAVARRNAPYEVCGTTARQSLFFCTFFELPLCCLPSHLISWPPCFYSTIRLPRKLASFLELAKLVAR